jgi:hypothetical protein
MRNINISFCTCQSNYKGTKLDSRVITNELVKGKIYIPAGKYSIFNGRVYPRTGHEGPDGEWSYSSTLSLTLAVDGVGGQEGRLLQVCQVCSIHPI